MPKHYLETEFLERLKTDESMFNWFEQGSLDGIWYWDLENPEQEWLSPKFKSIFGYQDNEIPHTSKWWQDNIFKADLPKVLENFDAHSADANHPYDQIVRYKHKTGKTVWIRCRGLIIRNNQGKPIRMLGAHTDVSELMQAQAQIESTQHQLEQTHSILKLAAHSANLGIWIWDVDKDLFEWNPEMFQLYNIEPSDFNGRLSQWLSYIHPLAQSEFQKNMSELLQDGINFTQDFELSLARGETQFIRTKHEIITDKENKITRIIGIQLDITKDKQSEIELKRSNEALSNFAFAASHDLKSPLRAVKEIANWVVEEIEQPSETISEYVNLLQSRIKRMDTLLSDLLDYAQVEVRNKAIEAIDTQMVMQGVSEGILSIQLSQPICFELVGDFPQIKVSKVLFEQVMNNLITNAIKHSEQELIEIIVGAKETEKDYIFYVQDNGEGIKPEFSEKIFEPFLKLKSKDTVEGSGLGLALVKRVVERWQGKLWFESNVKTKPEDESGTTFYFSVPKD